MQVHTISTPSLGDRTYLLTDGEVALVVDPQRDVDRVHALLDELGVTLAAVFETHIHNDYVTGGLALARDTGAAYHVNSADPVAFERVGVADGQVVEVGAMRVHVVATPGHTPTHLSFVVEHDDEVVACTGGSLLYGSVGRTDLVSADLTEHLTRQQFRSVRRLVAGLADDVAVLPTHGFGSFCSSGDTTGADTSTVGQEREVNQALVMDDEERFLQELLAGLDAYPTYYAAMAPRNLAGPTAPDLSPVVEVDRTEVLRRVHAGEWVVDLRTRTAFAGGHLAGSVNLELSDQSSTYLGWLVPLHEPVTLLSDDAEQITQLQRQLVRIGMERPAGQHVGVSGTPDAGATYPVTDFARAAAMLDERDDVVLLDARRSLEWQQGHVAGAVHVPLHELPARIDEVPAGEVLVHCASGYRASIATSLLERAGRRVVLVDDEFDANAARHLPIEKG